MSSASLQEIVCCIGQPVDSNPTQFIMERAFSEASLDWRYLTLEVASDDLGDALRGMRAMGFCGCHINEPHNLNAVRFVDRLSQSAELAQMVTCVIRQGNQLVGENTLGQGISQLLAESDELVESHVVLFGAGRAARAIAVDLGLGNAAKITIVNRTREPGEVLVSDLRNELGTQADFVLWDRDYRIAADTHIVIQATSTRSGRKAQLPIQFDDLLSHMTVVDLRLHPASTNLVEDARNRGCKVHDGLSVLVQQLAVSFKLWTGIRADTSEMREALEEFVGF